MGLVLIHNLFNCLAFHLADRLGKGMRAAGDVRFMMAWPIVTNIGVRLVFSVPYVAVFRVGVIALAMFLDWCILAVIFYIRFKSGKWKQY